MDAIAAHHRVTEYHVWIQNLSRQCLNVFSKTNLKIIGKRIEHKRGHLPRVRNSNFNFSMLPARPMKIGYNFGRYWAQTKAVVRILIWAGTLRDPVYTRTKQFESMIWVCARRWTTPRTRVNKLLSSFATHDNDHRAGKYFQYSPLW